MRCHCFLWLGGEHSLARPELLPSRFTQQLSHLLFFFLFSLSLSLSAPDSFLQTNLQEDDADEPCFLFLFFFFTYSHFLFFFCLLCKTIDQLDSRMLKSPQAFGNTQYVRSNGRQYVDVSNSIHNSSNRDQWLPSGAWRETLSRLFFLFWQALDDPL